MTRAHTEAATGRRAVACARLLAATSSSATTADRLVAMAWATLGPRATTRQVAAVTGLTERTVLTATARAERAGLIPRSTP